MFGGSERVLTGYYCYICAKYTEIQNDLCHICKQGFVEKVTQRVEPRPPVNQPVQRMPLAGRSRGRSTGIPGASGLQMFVDSATGTLISPEEIISSRELGE